MVTRIDGGVTAAKGYRCASMRVGIKPTGTNRDMAMVVCEVPAVCAGTFTRNKVKAAPVKWDMVVAREGHTAQAIVVNTGIANAATGEPGLEVCRRTAEAVEAATGIPKNYVICGSTGVIGPLVPVDKLVYGVKELSGCLESGTEAAHHAAEAIMTTDTHPKEIAVMFDVGGVSCTIGAMCKGSGMIHPNMGTMLCYIMSDVSVSYEMADKVLHEVVDKTFNMVSVDGDTSTNDTAIFMANGLAGNAEITDDGDDYEALKAALSEVCTFLARSMAKDGEGASRLFTAHVTGAPDYETARILAKSIITSNLTKAAIFGRDANCGRIFCAMGYSGADFDPDKTDITMSSSEGSIQFIEKGSFLDFDEDEALKILSPDEITAECCINDGDCEATAWGCDLTYDYVKINADYRS